MGAIGTVAAVIVALFLPGWLRARLRPVVTLHFDPATDDIALHERPPWVGVWIRLRVKNRPGRETARKVRVIVSDVEPEAGSQLPKNTLALRELSWSEIAAGELDVPAGMERRIDVAHVDKKRADREGMDRPWPDLGLGLAMWPRKYNGRDYLGEGAFKISLAVAGDNFDAADWEVRISFDRTGLSNRSSLAKISSAIRVSVPVLLTRQAPRRNRAFLACLRSRPQARARRAGRGVQS
jgi:hypothetical protein